MTAFAHALVGSLWQGALLWLAHAIWSRALRTASPRWRASATAVSIALICSLPVFDLAGRCVERGALDVPAARLFAGAAASERIAVLSPGWAGVIVAVWSTGAAVMLARIAGGLIALARMRRRSTPLALPQLARLADAAGLVTPPRARQVDARGAPCIVGWRRPALLLPAGVIAALAPDELDAIVLHELAHVRRRDFAVHLALRLVAALAWYQLPLRWLFAQLERDRERACDERAVAAGGRPLALARALVTLEQGRHDALAVASTGGALRERVLCLIAAAESIESDDARVSAAGVHVACAESGAAAAVPEHHRARSPGHRGETAAADRRARSVTVIAGLGGAAAMALCSAVLVLAGVPTAAPEGSARHMIRAHDPAGAFTVELVGEQLVAASIAGEALPRSRIVQDGKQVRLLDTAGDVALALDVEPPGIRWSARPRAAR